MNREKAAELLPILKAFSEGKTIECRSNRAMGDWKEAKVISELSLNSYEYRIKPEPTYRPFANAEECWAEMKKHEPFGWIIGLLEGGTHFLIICVRNDNYPITCNGGHTIFLPFDKLCNCYTFADGTPFGIKEK